jgi:hypothetical protein
MFITSARLCVSSEPHRAPTTSRRTCARLSPSLRISPRNPVPITTDAGRPAPSPRASGCFRRPAQEF